MSASAKVIAARLTPPQVNLLFYWPKGLFNGVTMRALQRRGLISGRTVTPLGLEVRRILANPTDGGK